MKNDNLSSGCVVGDKNICNTNTCAAVVWIRIWCGYSDCAAGCWPTFALPKAIFSRCCHATTMNPVLTPIPFMVLHLRAMHLLNLQLIALPTLAATPLLFESPWSVNEIEITWDRIYASGLRCCHCCRHIHSNNEITIIFSVDLASETCRVRNRFAKKAPLSFLIIINKATGTQWSTFELANLLRTRKTTSTFTRHIIPLKTRQLCQDMLRLLPKRRY